MGEITTGPGMDTDNIVIGFGGGNGTPFCLITCTMLQRAFLRAHPLFDYPMIIEPHVTKVPFRIADIPGQGKGLVATRPIAQGTTFYRKPPLYVGQSAMNSAQSMQRDDQIERNMKPLALAALDALDNCHRVEGKFARPWLERSARTPLPSRFILGTSR